MDGRLTKREFFARREKAGAGQELRHEVFMNQLHSRHNAVALQT